MWIPAAEALIDIKSILYRQGLDIVASRIRAMAEDDERHPLSLRKRSGPRIVDRDLQATL